MQLSAARDWINGRRPIILAAALAAVFILTGPGAEAKTIVVSDPVPPSSLNPFNQMDAVSHRACIQIYEHLTLLTSAGESVPELAESWTRIGRNVYHFKLRPGVKFHDGRPVTTDDVVYSLEAAKKGRLGSLLKVDRTTQDQRRGGRGGQLLAGPDRRTGLCRLHRSPRFGRQPGRAPDRLRPVQVHRPPGQRGRAGRL